MKKRTSSLLSVLLTLVMLLGLVPALSLTASAYSGSGTAANPYVATTYDAVRTLVADAPTDGTTRYIKLGANVVSSSNTDNNDIKLEKDNRQRVVLDLAGHSITRSETTSDCDVICVSAGYLTIQDSVGSGRVVEDIKVASAKTIPNTLYVFGSGHLTIESGTFESKNGCAIEGRGVSTVIDGGTFTSSNNFGVAMFYAGDLTVNGGNFQGEGRYGIFFTPPAVNCVINTCTISLKQSGGLISSNGAVRIKKCLGADSKVVNANGKEFRLDTACEITETYCRVTRPTVTINSIDITGIDAPVTGQPLDFTADCDTVGVKSVSVYWYNLSDKKTVSEGEVAQARKTYRVDVDLLPQTGYQFVGDKSEAVTINGEEAYIFGGTTEDLSVSYTFSETAAGKPVITKQPAAASGQVGSPITFSVTATGATGYNWYIYDAGDAQAYSWSSIKQHATVSGESTSKITITPTDTWLNGKVLDCTIKGSGGFAYTDQAKMTVTAAPKTISTVAVMGIDAPVIGATPDTTAAASPGMTVGRVTWSPADPVFKEGVAYTVTVTVLEEDGYTFESAVTATVNGQTAKYSRTRQAAKLFVSTVSYTFPALKAGTISSVAVTGIDAPEIGKTPDTTAVAKSEDYAISDIQWTPGDSKFVGGNAYAVEVILKAVEAKKFAPRTSATVNGALAVVASGGDTQELKIRYTFPALANEITNVAVTDLVPPVDGEKPVATCKLDGTGYTLKSMSWYDGSLKMNSVGTFQAGKTYQARFYLLPETGHSFSSVDRMTATVNGKAVEVSNVYGEPEQRAMIINFTCEKPAVVTVDGVHVDPISTGVVVGKTTTLTATITPEDAADKSVTWSSSDTSVAKVSSSGVVTGVKAGTATITATTTDGGKTATCQVTVTTSTVPVTGVNVTPAAAEVVVGKTTKLAASVAPENATNAEVTWKSSDTTVATVSATGVVTGVKAGTATITATTTDGGKTATCQVTVTTSTVPVTGVSVTPAAAEVAVGKTTKLAASVTPENATNAEVTWKSSDTTVATVSATGVVTGVKAGTATITATTADGGKTATCQVTVTEATNPTEKTPIHFIDVPEGSWYYDAVYWAVDQEITNGTSGTTFSPDGICTRAQAVTFLWRAAGSPAPKSTTMPFTDVKIGSYYFDAVLWAVENGITKGTSETTFSPDVNCSRAQIVTFLWRSEKSPAAGTVNPFTDVKSDAYYADAVLWAVKEDVTKGTTATTFSPDADCSRTQIVTFLYRYLAK